MYEYDPKQINKLPESPVARITETLQEYSRNAISMQSLGTQIAGPGYFSRP